MNWSNDGWTDVPKIRHSSSWFRSCSWESEAESKALNHCATIHSWYIYLGLILFQVSKSAIYREFYLVDPWQAARRVQRVIPVYTSQKIELLCSQQRTRYGITLSNCWLLPIWIFSWFVNKQLDWLWTNQLTLDTNRSCFISLGISVPRTAIPTWTFDSHCGQRPEFWQRCNSPFTLSVCHGLINIQLQCLPQLQLLASWPENSHVVRVR